MTEFSIRSTFCTLRPTVRCQPFDADGDIGRSRLRQKHLLCTLGLHHR